MRDEVTGVRPSRLRPLFRKWSKESLADWTRHLDVDWTWYCPFCAHVVLLIEEKQENALQNAWNVTHRMATRHEDHPWGWRVTCKRDGTFDVVGARSNGRDESTVKQNLSEEELLRWVTRVFENHYAERHPERKR
jgi:hypothetical protein